MEMDAFTSDVADSFGQCLSTFLLGLSGDTTLAKRSRAMFDADGNIRDANKVLDVSAIAAAKRASREVDDVLTTKKCGGTARDRLSIYKKQCAPSGLHIDEHDVKRMEGLSTIVKNAPISQKKEKKREDEEEDVQSSEA